MADRNLSSLTVGPFVTVEALSSEQSVLTLPTWTERVDVYLAVEEEVTFDYMPTSEGAGAPIPVGEWFEVWKRPPRPIDPELIIRVVAASGTPNLTIRIS